MNPRIPSALHGSNALPAKSFFARMRFAVAVAALLGCADLRGAEPTPTALVRHAPSLGGGTLEGSVQMMSGESVSLGGPMTVTRDLIVPGTPTMRVNGKPTFGGVIAGSGSASPSGYQVSLTGKASLRNVVSRTDPITLASVAAPRTPQGTVTVITASSTQPAPDFATLRHLTLADGVGQITVPPGAYGDFTAASGGGFTLGVAGATQPALYDFQRLTLPNGSLLQVAGPVIITVGNAMTVGGALGSSAHPGWLQLNLSAGGLTLGSTASLDGYINAPAGTVSLGGHARLTGGVIADGLALGGNALLRLQVPPAPPAPPPPPVNVAPTVALNAPAEGTLFTAPAAVRLAAAASDVDGVVSKVEFFEGARKLGEAVADPFELNWTNVPPGAYTLTAKAHDNAGATALSLARHITVQMGVPYFTGFEASDGYTLGAFAGQLGWTVTGTALVTESASHAGARALEIGSAAQARHTFPSTPTSDIVFTDVFAKPTAGTSAASSIIMQADAAHVAFVRAGDAGVLLVLNGNGAGGGLWTPAGSSVPLGADGRAAAWLRVTVRENFSAKRWDIFVNGRLVACELGFADNAAQGFAQMTLGASDTGSAQFDEFFVGFDNPLFVDRDRDGMDDAWETQNGLDPLVDDRGGDRDGDGLSNLQEYRHGTRANVADTDGDGLPDGWEVQHGLSPTSAAAPTADSDGDGLTDLQEFAAGTNPVSADTDADGMPDGWENANGLNPLVDDRNGDLDGDGVTNLREYQSGTRANLADTDGDTLPDGWEIRYGLSPIVAATTTDDFDGDGVSDLQEFALGLNPAAADTDGDGMPDGWELANGFNPLTSADAAGDPDGDGRSNLQEYQGGTNPNEYYNGVLPQLASSVGPNLRTAAGGLVTVRVTRLDGTLLANAPITLEATAGGILLSTNAAGLNAAPTVALRTDAQALAAVYVQYPAPAAELSTLVARAQSGAEVKTLTITLRPPITDFDADQLDDEWEQRYLGGLTYGADEDPGSIGRPLSQSHYLDASPWPNATVSSGLQAWYRADLGVGKDAAQKVSRWVDLSGNAVHVGQASLAAQPVAVASAIGGQAALRFDGVASTLRTSAPVNLMKGSTDATVIVIVKAGATQQTYADILDYNHGTAPFGGFALQQNENAVNRYGFGWRDPGNSTWIGLTPTLTITSGAPQLLGFVKGGTTQAGYLNAAPAFTAAVPAQMLVNAPRIFSVASFATDNSRYFNGEIAEILFYNRALTTAERTAIEEACGTRYFDADTDGLSDLWEQAKLGTTSFGAQDDPGGVGRTLSQSFAQGLSPWPAATVSAGLQLWYRADLGVGADASGRVNRWTDLSGTGAHALQAIAGAQPELLAAAFGTKPAIRFNGSSTVLRSGAVDLMKGSQDVTVIAVLKSAPTQVQYSDILDYDHAMEPYGGFVLQQNGGATNQYGMWWFNASTGQFVGATPTVTVPSGPVQVLTMMKAGSAQTGFLNGGQQASASISGTMALNTPRAVAIGNFALAGGRAFNGDIAEILVYNRGLSAAERAQVEAALAAKYGN